MGKRVLKQDLYNGQNGLCDLSNSPLQTDPALQDTDRINPKAKGGIYTKENTRLVNPVDHMKRHGIHRVRTPLLRELKELLDDREQVRKLHQKVSNQMLAFKRNTDTLNKTTVDWLEHQIKLFSVELKARDAAVTSFMKDMAKVDPLVRAALGVKGIGPITVAYCISYIDLSKARHASCLWSYTGLHKASHERYEKGVAGGGNKTLRTVLYTMADSMLKSRGAYREVYDNVKTRLEHSEKITKSRNTEGKLIECAWKDTKLCHRHGAGLRAIMKHFLADYWSIGRRSLGLPVDALYPEAILGGNHRTIQPEERGWVLDMNPPVKKERKKYTRKAKE